MGPHATFDGDELLAVVGVHLDMLEELRDIFAGQYPSVLGGIREAIRARNGKVLADQAHLMKNVTGMAGGPSGRQLSVELEDAANDGDFSRATQLTDQLEQELLGLEQALNAFVAARGGA